MAYLFLLYVCGFDFFLLVSLFLCMLVHLVFIGFILGPYYREDLEDMMFDCISESFDSDFQDGSVEEVIIFLSVMLSAAIGPELCLSNEYLIKYLLV